MKPGRLDDLVEHVATNVWPSVTAADGFVGGEILRSVGRSEQRLLLVTRWRDEEALEHFLGPAWTAHELTPVPDEASFLGGVPFVDNWLVVGTGDRKSLDATTPTVTQSASGAASR